MAIFNNGDIADRGQTTDSNTAIITAGAKIKGEVDLTCNLYIDGELEGAVHSSKQVNIGKNGHVNGEIKTNHLIVQGLVEGVIDAQRVEIRAAGHVIGEIASVELVIESKGVFEGNSVVKSVSDTLEKSDTGN